MAEPVALNVESIAISLVLRISDGCFNSAMTLGLALRPLSARSVVLSLLLGAHPAELSAAALVRAGDLFEVPETTLRATLSRMVAAGDLVRDGSTYRLSERLLERQRRQDAALDAETTPLGRHVGTGRDHLLGPERPGPRRAPRRRWLPCVWASCARACGCVPPTWPGRCRRGPPT